jgi:hypothetical protein
MLSLVAVEVVEAKKIKLAKRFFERYIFKQTIQKGSQLGCLFFCK